MLTGGCHFCSPCLSHTLTPPLSLYVSLTKSKWFIKWTDRVGNSSKTTQIKFLVHKFTHIPPPPLNTTSIHSTKSSGLDQMSTRDCSQWRWGFTAGMAVNNKPLHSAAREKPNINRICHCGLPGQNAITAKHHQKSMRIWAGGEKENENMSEREREIHKNVSEWIYAVKCISELGRDLNDLPCPSVCVYLLTSQNHSVTVSKLTPFDIQHRW